jgi:hypothetical protein
VILSIPRAASDGYQPYPADLVWPLATEFFAAGIDLSRAESSFYDRDKVRSAFETRPYDTDRCSFRVEFVQQCNLSRLIRREDHYGETANQTHCH